MKKILLIIMMAMFIMSAAKVVNAINSNSLEITLLNQDPDPAEQGKYLDVRWKVIKIGDGAMENIEFLIEPKQPFSIDKTETPTRELGTWRGESGEEEYAVIHYKLKVADEAIEDNYKIKLSYRFKGSTWISQEFDLRVGEFEEPNFVLGTLVTSPRKLTADTDEAQLDVEISNIGKKQADNVQVQLRLPEGFEASYTYADRDNLGSIDGGESKTATFYIDADKDLEAIEYLGTLTLSYKESDKAKQEKTSLSLPLPIKPKPQFEIQKVTYLPEKLFAGQEVQMTVTAKNIGEAEAESVSLRVFKESSQPFDFEEKTDYIGKLLPGETGQATFSLLVEEGADPKDYVLDLEFRSISNNEVIIEDESISLNVSAGQAEKDLGILPAVLIGVILLVLVGFFSYRQGVKKTKK